MFAPPFRWGVGYADALNPQIASLGFCWCGLDRQRREKPPRGG
jgi:hypothetical protein